VTATPEFFVVLARVQATDGCRSEAPARRLIDFHAEFPAQQVRRTVKRFKRDIALLGVEEAVKLCKTF
jgi:hypothetical protein